MIDLNEEERAELTRRSRSRTLSSRDVERAKIVLAAAKGLGNREICRRLSLSLPTIRRWRSRFACERLAGLSDKPRPGAEPKFGPEVRARVRALACQLPAERGLPLARASVSDIHAELRLEGVSIARSTVGLYLQEDALKPWRQQSWVFPPVR